MEVVQENQKIVKFRKVRFDEKFFSKNNAFFSFKEHLQQTWRAENNLVTAGCLFLEQICILGNQRKS